MRPTAALALSVLSLVACSPAAKSVPAPQGGPAAYDGTAINAACAYLTGDRKGAPVTISDGVTITADDHIVRWSEVVGGRRSETDSGPSPGWAANIRRRLDRIRFAEIRFNESGNTTCWLSAGDHKVSWSHEDEDWRRVPSGVVGIHGRMMDPHGGHYFPDTDVL